MIGDATLARLLRGTGLAALAAYVVLTAIALTERGDTVTSYAAVSPVAAVAALVPGVALILAGVLIRTSPQDDPVAFPLLLAGVAWLAPIWIGRPDGPAVVRSLGMVVAPFLLPALVHLAVGFVDGTPGRHRQLAGTAYLVTAVISLGQAAVRDPFLDPRCWTNCTDNVFVLHADPVIAGGLDQLWVAATVVFGGAIVVITLTRPAGTKGWSAFWPVSAGIAAAGAAEATYAVALVVRPVEDPAVPMFLGLFLVRAAALTVVGGTLSWIVLRRRHRRLAVARLAGELGATPPLGGFQSALAAALGDADLEVRYWLPHAQRYVDASGRPWSPRPDDSRATATITRQDQPVALVLHNRARADPGELEHQIGSAARLAIDNERLRAEVLAQLAELRSSRHRVIATADAARRRLERDLHDGAQQRLLVVIYELRQAVAEATTRTDLRTVTVLADALDQVRAALAELRELAHGIFPAVLDQAGLAVALTTAAEQAPIAVDLGPLPGERLPAAVEGAAYLTVTTAIERAADRRANHVRVAITHDGGVLAVRVDGAPDDRYPDLADRIGALGGELTAGGGCLRVEIPCG